jgi:hypothetical protein
MTYGTSGPSFISSLHRPSSRRIADDAAYAKNVRELTAILQEWMEQTDDFPATYRVRDDHTDRITGVQFGGRIPPLRNAEVPPPGERWGSLGPR